MKKIVAFIAVLIYMTCAGTVWGQTLSNPQDVTWRITNPNFDSNADGWNGSPSWYQKCVEKWNAGSVDVYQELTELPAGLYSVSVDGLYRPGSSTTTSLDRHAVLYANESSTPLWHINVSRETEKLETDDKTITVDGQTYYVPFNRLSASRYFAKGVYTDNRVWVIVSEDGNLRIGIKKDVVVENDWICFDNFQLTYYGEVYTASTGTYYLQNVATGEYLQGGMVHGTDAAMGNGIPFELVKKSDGIYQIRSGIGKSGSDYLCDEGRLSHAPTDFLIVQTSNGNYNIVTTNTGCTGSDITSGRMLTAGVVDLNSLNFVEWSQSNPGGTIVKDWGYVETHFHNRYLPNHEYKEEELVYGTRDVNPVCYSDLTGYGTMTIRGAAGSVIRVLLNGKVQDANDYTEITCTIGSNGVSTIDLSGYEYVHLNAIKVPDGNTAIIEGITLTKNTVSLSDMQFALWSQSGQGGSIENSSPENFENHIGSQSLVSGNTVYGDGGVYPQNYADLTGYKSMTIKATPKSVFRVLFNRAGTNTALGSLEEKVVTIGDNGLGYLDFSDLSYAHLNAIKIAWGSIASTVESITLRKIKIADNAHSDVAFVANDGNTGEAQWRLVSKVQRIGALKDGTTAKLPKDATFLIDNAALTIDDATLGTSWSGIESADWGPKEDYKNNCVEKFNKTTFDAYQTISGLPAGVYELTVQGYYRSGDLNTAATKAKEGTDILRPFLYVKQGENLIGQAPLLSIFDTDVTTSGVDGFTTLSNGEYLPNTLGDAAKAFAYGYYGANGDYNKVRFVVPSDDATVRIGVKTNVHYGTDWAVFDNSQLTYLGKTGEVQMVCLSEIGTTQTYYLKNAQTGTYLTAGGTDGVSAVLGDRMYDHSVYQDIAKYHAGVRETSFTFLAVHANKYQIQTGIGDGYLTLDGKVNGKETYHIVKMVAGSTNECVVYDPTPVKVDDKEKYRFLNNKGYSTVPEEDEDLTKNTPIRWVFQSREDLIKEFSDASEDNPIDATFLLRSASFHKDDSRNSAWTGIRSGEIGGTVNNYVGHASGGRTFDIIQKVTDVPAGVYEYTLQGYYVTEEGTGHSSAKYYVSPDHHYSYLASQLNDKNYTLVDQGQKKLVWEINFLNPELIDKSLKDPDKTDVVTLPEKEFDIAVPQGMSNINSMSNIMIKGSRLNTNFGVSTNSEWLQRYKGLYLTSSGQRMIGISNLKAGQLVEIKTTNTSAFGVANADALELISSTDGKVTFRALKDGNAGITVARNEPNNNFVFYIERIAVYYGDTEQTSINGMSDASSVFLTEQGAHPVIRFEVKQDNGTIVLGAVNTEEKPNASLYIDNVRLTYIGKNVDGMDEPTRISRGIIHKRSYYYDLAIKNGDITLKSDGTINSNNTTLSNDMMIKNTEHGSMMVQNTSIYRETIYAKAGQALKIVMPSAFTSESQSSGKYYQRFYNYKTEGVPDVGTFVFKNDAEVRKLMMVYEGTTDAPAGGWLFGSRWSNQMVASFNYTTPSAGFEEIMIGIDHSDFTDVGDMGLFGDLTEPTLAQRIIYTIRPASAMVEKLDGCTGDVFLEVKSISFPTIWHGLKGTDLNSVALDMQLRNYFTGADVPVPADFEVELEANGTGIELTNVVDEDNDPNNNTDNKRDLIITENGTKAKFNKDTRFIRFKYPEGGVVTNYKKTAYIYVRSKGKNIAKFILDFVPNTELRPWKDIMGQTNRRRSPIYLEEHANRMDSLKFDKKYFDASQKEVTHPQTWSVGAESAINGIEYENNLSSYDQFNPYPLDFAQTSFAAYYPNAVWGQYSLMKSVRIPSYKDIRSFKDISQLYFDKKLKEEGDGYFMYIDASNFPSSIATLDLDQELCAGTTILFSGWVSAMDPSTSGNDPGYLLFSIVGKDLDEDGKVVSEEVVESFCPGPIRADAMSYNSGRVTADTYNKDVWPAPIDPINNPNGNSSSNSIWQQFAFSFIIQSEVADKYDSYALRIDNYCSSTTGGDMMLDDVRLYIQNAVPDIMQESPVCEVGKWNDMRIYTKFDKLLSAVNKDGAESEDDAKGNYGTKSNEEKILPSAWYCFLDKEVYETKFSEGYENAFNAALIRKGGNYEGYPGIYKFDFSTCFESNGTVYEYDAYGVKDSGEELLYLDPMPSLKDIPYYVKNSSGTWETAQPGWVMGKSSATVYGDGNNVEALNRYVDLSDYEELRVYQEENIPIRCFFFKSTGGYEIIYSTENNKYHIKKESYHAFNLNAIKADYGTAKLICIKGAAGAETTVSHISLYKQFDFLSPNKKYEIVFRATAGEPDLTDMAKFFMMNNENNKKCAAMETFSLVSGSIIRINGSLSSDNSSYCAGQIATLKVELQGVNKNRAVMQEDRFYDWWLGDKESLKTANNGEGLYAYQVLENFRAAYPEEEYDNQDPIDGVFTEADKTYLKELITPQVNNEGEYEPARLYLYQSSLNVRVTDKDSDGQMHITVIPVDAQLAEANYCDPIQVSMVVSGKAPTAKDGFKETSYLDYLNEVPLRIGLEQVKSVTDGAKDSWGSDDKVLYVPLRDIAFSGTTGFSNGFKKVNHKDMEIAAVFLAETNDPEMISYDVNQEGDKEMRYVGKVRTFAAATGRNKFEDYVKLTFNPGFTPKEGYRYTLKTSFVETNADGNASTCHGDLLIPLYIVPEYQVWVGGPDGNWANDDNWRRADNGELKFATTDRPTNEANTTSQGFVPMDFTKVLMKSNNVAELKSVTKDGDLVKFSDTDGHTPDIQYHLAAKNDAPWVSSMRETDIYCEPFYTNTAKEVHFEPYSQMLNTQYLTYERAWVEYALESGRWYTLSSPLQGVVSGDMYLPRGTAKQETPYFDPITYNNTDYTRLAPAVYQQAWDKAEATLYRLERDQLDNYRLPDWERNTATANVARAFDWSYEYNDVKVPFGVNGFSVKVDMRIKDYSKKEGVKDVLLRLPKDDKTYRYYMYDDDHNGSQTVDLTTTVVNGKNLRENAGKLFTDGMPTGSMTVTLTNNSADNPYFLVGNPFMSGLDLDKFFEENGGLENKYWILTKDSYSASIKTGEQWASTDEFTTGNVAPLQAFFVKKIDGTGGTLNVKFTSGMAVQLAEDALQTRAGGAPATLRLTAMRDGVESRSIVVCREEATEGFSAGEDVEALFDSNLSHAPTLYTAAGEVAAAINVRRTLHGVPVGIGGEDETEVTLTFDGVEQFGEELYLYDAAEGTSTLIPASGTSLSVCGRTTGRYYLVTTPLDGSAQESVPVVSVQGRVVTVLSAFDEILSIEAYDAMGCRVYADGAVGNRTRFALPAQGVYLITVKTAAGVFCHKVLVNS